MYLERGEFELAKEYSKVNILKEKNIKYQYVDTCYLIF